MRDLLVAATFWVVQVKGVKCQLKDDSGHRSPSFGTFLSREQLRVRTDALEHSVEGF